MDEFDDLEEGYITITMKDDEGNDIEFEIIDSLEHNGNKYMLVVESDDDSEEPEAFIFKETRIDGKESIFEEVENDIEFDEVSDLFQSDDYDIEV